MTYRKRPVEAGSEDFGLELGFGCGALLAPDLSEEEFPFGEPRGSFSDTLDRSLSIVRASTNDSLLNKRSSDAGG